MRTFNIIEKLKSHILAAVIDIQKAKNSAAKNLRSFEHKNQGRQSLNNYPRSSDQSSKNNHEQITEIKSGEKHLTGLFSAQVPTRKTNKSVKLGD